MRRFACRCGQRVFFENFACLYCGAALGFDPGHLSLVALEPAGAFLASPDGRCYRVCRNRTEHEICNWLIGTEETGDYCLACRLNSVIPNLSVPGNLLLWGRMEAAKRRLLYDLLSRGLPLTGGGDLPRLRFRFIEDQRRNPLVEESFVATGHYAGTITVNLAEADDSARYAAREQMRERYRTLLGHLRHETGHFYFGPLVQTDAGALEAFRSLFGDERADYQQAIEAYYADPSGGAGYEGRHVSRYASAHPLEDWAETWAHYLHIADGLETGWQCGIAERVAIASRSTDWIERWSELSITLNELNRSLGVDDAYPFALTPTIMEKLSFVHRRAEQASSPTAAWASR